MSMRILFADDSMTAQNMGKKILTEAGYEVVAVSNGAAAVKKIAEQKPDIIILDIYMPGYSGLEVCDKVRASIETLKTPVLLTVGKMEPYRAEDASRVKADGVIIKPFEASDLLAVIRRLEERVVPKASSSVTEQTVLLERPPEFPEFPGASDNHATHENTVQVTVDVPDNMASSAAFSDLLGPEPVHSPDSIPFPAQASAAEFAVFPEAAVESPASAESPQNASVVEAESAVSAPETLVSPEAVAKMPEPGPNPGWDPAASASYSASDFGMDLSAIETAPASSAEEAERLAPVAPGDAVEAEPVAGISSQASAPVEEAIAPPRAQDEAWQTRDVEVESFSDSSNVYASAMLPAPEVQPGPPTSPAPEPATNTAQIDSFSAQIEEQIQRIETIVSASEARHMEAEATTNGARSAEDDFEARVAAAMSIYDEPNEDRASPSTVAAIDAEESPAAVNQHPTAAAPASEAGSVELPYSFEYTPPITSPEGEPAVQPTEVVTAFAAESQPSSQEVRPRVVEHPVTAQPEANQIEETIKSQIEAQLPAAAVAAVDPGIEDEKIASVVHRVLERLKPHLIQEISRELNAKKPPEI